MDRTQQAQLAKSFTLIRPSERNIKLLILQKHQGRSLDCDRDISRMISESALEDTIRIHDSVAYEEVPEFISIADLCISPFPDMEWWRIGSPFKLMEYIASGKNILMTNMVAHTNVVGTGSQYFFVDEVTPESFSKKIREVYETFRASPTQFYERGITERRRLIHSISWESRAMVLEGFLSRLSEA